MHQQVLLGEHDYWDSGESSMVSTEILTKKRTLYIHQEAAVHILHNFNFHNHQETTLHIIDDIPLEDEDGHLRDHHARGLRQQHCRSGLRSAQDGQKGASVMK